MHDSWQLKIEDDRVRVGKRFSISFQRTLRLPDDGQSYPLPPTLGLFPVKKVMDYEGRIPVDWRDRGGVFFPMYQREAMWLAFDTTYWKPNAVMVGIGGINALTGDDWQDGLNDNPQNYLVCPEQPWLDGINAGDDTIRQFIAMPLGSGYTVEGQLTGEERIGGFQILVYDPKQGLFPDEPPPAPERSPGEVLGIGPPQALQASQGAVPATGMGIAAGGHIKQKIYPDPYGLNTWNQDDCGELIVHIVNSEQYQAITGETPPPTVIDAQTYSRYGLPWFELYDEDEDTLASTEKLSGISSVRQLDESQGIITSEDKEGLDIDPKQLRRIESQKHKRQQDRHS